MSLAGSETALCNPGNPGNPGLAAAAGLAGLAADAAEAAVAADLAWAWASCCRCFFIAAFDG